MSPSAATEEDRLHDGVSICIPAFNEEAGLQSTVEDLLRAVGPRLTRFEILIVDDGSADGTNAIGRYLAAEHPQTRLLTSDRNRGMGASLRLAIANARYKCFTGLPADFSYDADSVADVISQYGRADIVFGYRVNQHEARPLHRRVLSRAFSVFAGLLMRRRIRDIHGLFIYPTGELRALELAEERYAICLEMAIKLLRKDLTVFQFPVRLRLSKSDTSGALNPRTAMHIARVFVRLMFS